VRAIRERGTTWRAISLVAGLALLTGAFVVTAADAAQASGVPTPPAFVFATSTGGGAASINWFGESDGGSPITTYTVTASPGGHTATVDAAAYVFCRSSSVLVVGLTDGVSYTFSVVATNSIGDSNPSGPTSPVVAHAAFPWGTGLPPDGTGLFNGAALVPPDGASYVLDQPVTIRTEVMDASAALNVYTLVDGHIVRFHEFDPFDCPPTQLDTSTPGTHTVTWVMLDTVLAWYSLTRTYYVVDPSDPDTDADGIYNVVDTNPSTPSTEFYDGTTAVPTYGEIVDPNGLNVTVRDAADPNKGVRAIVGPGSGDATLQICGFPLTMASAGTDANFTCNSLIVEVTTGAVNVELGGGVTVVSVPSGGSAEITQLSADTFSVENLGTTEVAVTVDGVATSVPAGGTQQVAAWDFRGFTTPVDNPYVLNVVNAGQVVPLRWRLVRSDGTPVTDLSSASIHVSTLSCSEGITSDQVEELATGGTGLLNLANGYYQLNWKAPKTYAKSCKTLHLDLGEGISRDAMFRFPK
jgi:hypothetical protein